MPVKLEFTGWKKRPGLRAAINAQCKSCIYDPSHEGSGVDQVEACTAETLCPLWAVRNRSKKEKVA